MSDRDGLTTLVLALGNPLMGDDGFGLAVLARLRRRVRERPGLTLMDGGTWGMNLLPAIEACDRLLIIDAISTGAEPGTLVRLEREELPRYFSMHISPHQVDLREVLALAELRGTLPPILVALGVEPHTIRLGTLLSPAAGRKVQAVTDAAVRQLAAWGHREDIPTAVNA
jgi:hydrogenase maturation protease